MTEEQIKSQERKVGRAAAKMAEAYLLQVIKGRLNIKNQGLPDGPILEETKVKMKMGQHRLLGLNLQSNKAGFILNYGFTGVRQATSVYYKASRYKISRSQRKSHQFNLPAHEIFEDFFEKSGAIDYLFSELSKTRGESFQLKLNRLTQTFNAKNNG